MNTNPTEHDKAIYYAIDELNKLSKDDLLEYQWQMNGWRWPFSEYKDFYESLGNNSSGIISYLHEYTDLLISKKDSLKYHNVIKIKSMTEEEFEKNWLDGGFMVTKNFRRIH